MYTVNFLIKNSPNAVTLCFKAFKAADDLWKKGKASIGTEEKIEVEDDYEMKGVIDMSSVSAITFADFDKDMGKAGQMEIDRAKGNLRTQNLAKNDMGLQMLQQAANGAQHQ